MKRISYIDQNNFERLIKYEVERTIKEGKKFIFNADGFRSHLMRVGLSAESISLGILKNHPTLKKILSPDIMRVAGFMHDFSKFEVGDPYHEIEGAYTILKRGEDLELVVGGSKSDRKDALKRMARCLPSDGVVYEQLGENPPETTIYKSFFTDEMAEKTKYIRRELAEDSTPLNVEELTSPRNLEQKVVIYADYTDLEGDKISLKERLKEVYERYNLNAENVNEKEVEKYKRRNMKITKEEISEFYKSVPRLLQQTMLRTLAVIGTIDELLSYSA